MCEDQEDRPTFACGHIEWNFSHLCSFPGLSPSQTQKQTQKQTQTTTQSTQSLVLQHTTLFTKVMWWTFASSTQKPTETVTASASGTQQLHTAPVPSNISPKIEAGALLADEIHSLDHWDKLMFIVDVSTVAFLCVICLSTLIFICVIFHKVKKLSKRTRENRQRSDRNFALGSMYAHESSLWGCVYISHLYIIFLIFCSIYRHFYKRPSKTGDLQRLLKATLLSTACFFRTCWIQCTDCLPFVTVQGTSGAFAMLIRVGGGGHGEGCVWCCGMRSGLFTMTRVKC